MFTFFVAHVLLFSCRSSKSGENCKYGRGKITEGNWFLVSSRQSRFLQSFFKNLPQSWFLHGRTAAPAVALSKEKCRWASHALRILQSLSSSVAELIRKLACSFRYCCIFIVVHVFAFALAAYGVCIAATALVQIMLSKGIEPKLP